MANETYENYWNMVLGTSDAEGVVREFELTGPRIALDEWLGTAESEARVVAAEGHGPSEELCEQYHERALNELVDAVESKEPAPYAAERTEDGGVRYWSVYMQTWTVAHHQDEVPDREWAAADESDRALLKTLPVSAEE